MRHIGWTGPALTMIAALGCAADVATQEPTGAVAIALRQTDPSGDVYRLRAAVLEVTGTLDQTFQPADDDDVVQADLPVGDYMLTLASGWRLERERAGQFQDVAATLLSQNPRPFTIAPDNLTSLSLRFSLDAQGPLVSSTGQLAVTLAVETSLPAPPPAACSPQLVINEVDYDQPGSDTAEFVELYNAGACDLSTVGLVLALRNGFSTPAPVYAQIPLDAAGPVIPSGAYLVVGVPAVLSTLPVGVLGVALGGTAIQNGNPDGIHVEQAGQILDAMSYGGDVPGVTETASAPLDPGAGSLGRCPDGADINDGSVDFLVSATMTPGAANSCP